MALVPQESLRRTIGSTSAATPSPRISNPVEVSWFGAVGNGTTDDTAAILAAMTAAGPGGGVFFTPGKTYLTTSAITVPVDYLTLVGYGAIITSTLDTQFRKFIFSARTRGAIRGLRFECLYSTATKTIGAGVVEISASTGINIEDCEFNEVAQSGVYVLGASSRISILNNKFYKNFCAIFSDDDTVNQPTGVIVRGNHIRTGLSATTVNLSGAIKFSGAGTANSYAGHVIEGNQIDTPGQMGIELQTWVNGCAIDGNTIYGAGFGISISGCADISIGSSNVVKGCVNFGIEVTGVVASESRNIAIGAVTVNGSNTSGTVVCGYGIYIGLAIGVAISGATVTQCVSLEIDVTGATDVVVSACSTVGKGYNLKNCTRVTLNACILKVGTSASYFVFIDSNDSAVSKINILGCTFQGTVASNGILLYSPANSIADVVIARNITTGASAVGWMYNTSVSGAGSVARIKVEGNTGDGTQAFEVNFNVGVRSIATDLTLGPAYETLLVDATSGAKAITLPTAVGITGKVFCVQRIDAFNNVTVQTTGGQTINGAATVVLSAQWQRVTVQSNGTHWAIIQSN